MEAGNYYDDVRNLVDERLNGKGSYSVTTRNVEKTNQCYTGLEIRKTGVSIAPVFDLDAMLARHIGGVEAVADEIIKQLDEVEKEALDVDFVYNYENVKDKLVVRIVSAERNISLLDKIPHKRMYDLAMIYSIDVSDGRKGNKLINVTYSMLDAYGIDQETLHEDAMKNSPKVWPATVNGLEDFLEEMTGHSLIGESGLIVITNRSGICGASAVFYPDVAGAIEKMTGGSYYLLPSSVHEFLAIKPSGKDDEAEMLQNLVSQVNRTEVSPEDVLSDHVYYYDTETKKIRMAA